MSPYFIAVLTFTVIASGIVVLFWFGTRNRGWDLLIPVSMSLVFGTGIVLSIYAMLANPANIRMALVYLILVLLGALLAAFLAIFD